MAVILYSYRRCPYAMRARSALILAKVIFEVREISLRNKPPSFLVYSPKGTVPVLVMPDQSVIDQSLDIMDWALHQPDARNYLPDDEESKLFTRKWIMANDDSFKNQLDAYKYPERYVEITQENSLAYALETYLLPLNQLLVQQPFLLGGYFQLVDLAIFPFIRQFAMVDLERFKQLPLPYLQKWLNFFLQSELFEQVMTKYPLWIDPKLTLTNS